MGCSARMNNTRLLSNTCSCHAEKFEERPEFNLHETHFDHITQPAPGMTVLGYSENTPVQMCCVGDHYLGGGTVPGTSYP